jgi:hypothetical protein
MSSTSFWSCYRLRSWTFVVCVVGGASATSLEESFKMHPFVVVVVD